MGIFVCFVLFYFIGVLHCAIFCGFCFLLHSLVIVDINVSHFSRGVFVSVVSELEVKSHLVLTSTLLNFFDSKTC